MWRSDDPTEPPARLGLPDFVRTNPGWTKLVDTDRLVIATCAWDGSLSGQAVLILWAE